MAKVKYEGMRATSKYLNVYAQLEVGQTVRFVEVKIPLSELDCGVVTEALDRKVRMDLLAIWSQMRDEDPLF